MAFGTWFGESQAEPVKQQQTGISPNHVPEAVRYWVLVYLSVLCGHIAIIVRVKLMNSKIKVTSSHHRTSISWMFSHVQRVRPAAESNVGRQFAAVLRCFKLLHLVTS